MRRVKCDVRQHNNNNNKNANRNVTRFEVCILVPCVDTVHRTPYTLNIFAVVVAALRYCLALDLDFSFG